MTKLPTRCRYVACLFVTTADCTCSRCMSVKASGFCNTQHEEAHYEEKAKFMEHETRRASNE